ncbi:MAG TPA: SufD family Fe-S cluster assembly protein [Thermoplasmata archaeon]|nr:SufD family Fe-S cluster assembly protein [Thermoplasmata archaeon]
MAVAEATPVRWVPDPTAARLSAVIGDSPELARRRAESARAVAELPLEPDPLYRKYGYFAGVDLTGIDPLTVGTPVPAPPPDPQTVTILHDRSGTRLSIPPELQEAGVRVELLHELVGPRSGADGFLGPAEPPTDRLSALSLALLNRGYQLHIPERFPIPVRLKETTILSEEREAISVRRRFQVGAGTRLLATEELFSTGPGDGQRCYASTSEVQLGAGANAVVVSLHAPDPKTVSVYQRHATVHDRGRLRWVWVGLGGFRTKIRNSTEMPGTAADVDDLQTFFGDSDQSYDSYVRLTHIGTDTHAQSITRGVFQGTSRGMSRGLVRIEKEARKTISYISEHAMLLNRGARSDTVPILEILCRDVKATHSTSVAPVDPERVFYLESRGIPRAEATRLISEGYLANVLDRAPVAGLRDLVLPLFGARWEKQPIVWGPDRFPTLPPLEFAGAEAATDWRFDSKLR